MCKNLINYMIFEVSDFLYMHIFHLKYYRKNLEQLISLHDTYYQKINMESTENQHFLLCKVAAIEEICHSKFCYDDFSIWEE